MLKPYKLVIFDLDGTLLDTLTDLANAVNLTLMQWGFPQHAINDYRYFIGNGVYKLIERALPADQRTEDMILHVTDRFKLNYYKTQTANTRPYPEIPETLAFLRSKSVRMAVASNKYHQASVEIVSHYFGENTFDMVLGQREGIEPKPHPRIVQDILQKTGCRADETLFLGDSGVDMLTATGSGCTAVGAAWGIRPREELLQNGAEIILEHPLEITQFFS